MKSLPLVVLLLVSCALQAFGDDGVQDNIPVYDPCAGNGVIEFKQALESFVAPVYKRAALYNDYNFVISPLTMWLSLSAIAEGADDSVQHQLFQALNLPEAMCIRQKFYQIASRLEPPGPEVTLGRKRALILNENVNINENWASFVNDTGILEYMNNDQGLTSSPPSGNSMIVDTLDFEGLWTTAFPEESIESAPFFDDAGVEIGEVELMRMKKHMRAAYLPDFTAKALELPMGLHGRYSMLIVMGLEGHPIKEIVEIFPRSIILQITQALKYSSFIPSEIAVPKFEMITAMEARYIIEEVGIESIWSEPAASMYVSDPPAVPSQYIQKVSVQVDSAGLNPAPSSDSEANFKPNLATGRAPAIGDDFIANKPFMYFLIDTRTDSVLFAGAFSNPNYD